METSGTSEVTTNVAENSESTVEIKIKTLDSQTYTLRVDKCVPIPRLKEQIATVTGVVSEQQRLICRGKVLKDDELLSAYHVEDGHTLHLVVRQPYQSSSSASGQVGPEGSAGHPEPNSSSTTAGNRSNQGPRTVVFETVNIGQGDHPNQHVSQIISSIISAFVTASTGSNISRTDTRDSNASRSGDALRPELGSRQVPLSFQSTAPLGPQQPTVIPDSLTTINEYMHYMRDEFMMEGFRVNGSHHTEERTAGMHSNHTQSHDLQSHQSNQGGLPSPASLADTLISIRQLLTEQAGGYMSQFARRLEDHVSLTDPTMRLDFQNTVWRSGVLLQDLGSLLLELGRTTMMLRLGQTPSEAVINAGPAIFISGSGPNPLMVQPVPFYPGSSFGALRHGALNSGHNLQGEAAGSAFAPANIGIRLRAGRRVPVSTANQSEQAGVQQSHEQIDPTRSSSGTNTAYQGFPGVPDSASFATNSVVRVVPLRTVFALNRSPSDASGGAMGLIGPVLARVHHVNDGNVNDARGNPALNEPNQDAHNSGQLPNLVSAALSQNLESNSGGITGDDAHPVTAVSIENLSVNDPAVYQGSSVLTSSSQQGQPTSHRESNSHDPMGQQSGIDPFSQLASRVDQLLRTFFPGAEVQVSGSMQQETSGGSATDQAGPTEGPATDQAGPTENTQSEGSEAGDDGVFFSNLVRQLMPFISQATATGQDSSPSINSSTSQATRLNSGESSSSQHPREPPEAPSPKRLKRESE